MIPHLFSPLIIFFPFIFGFIVVDLLLKGVALWKSARNGQKAWFVSLLIINSLGILPTIYLLFCQRKPKKLNK
jgi:vacuolar-type H+-ATPase subunit I/STV1